MANPFWEQYNGFTVEGAGSPPNICAYAAQFKQWADMLCVSVATIAAVDNDEGVMAVNRALVQLIKKYFEWRSAVPKAHKNRIGEQGHTCVFHVFEAAYQQLRTMDLSLSPPRFQPVLLPAPPPAQVIQIKGIPLADIEER